MRRRWRLRPCAAEDVERLAAELAITSRLARLLASRGIVDAAHAATFLDARLSDSLRSPLLFRAMPTAAERVVAAVARGEKIGIFGDYDVDGISGSAILIRFLRALGSEPALYIPQRQRDGYGLKPPGIDALAADGVGLMITVDCGGCSHDEIAYASTLGIDTIVCDHHQVSGRPLPAHAVLNPIEPDAGFPFRGLSGAGVAFYLALGTRMALRQLGRTEVPDLRRSLDLAALGTVADVVPLLEENRVIVRHGVKELTRSAVPGVVALKEVSKVAAVTSRTVGFRLAPRLNAAGRLSDARRSVELLATDDPVRARELALSLDDDNRARQQIEREMLADALAQIERDPDIAAGPAIVLGSRDWHAGVVGIVAARLVDRFHRPAVLVAFDPATGIGRGSGRSIAKINLHAAFLAGAEHTIGFGGHPMAAGLTITEESLPAFAQAVAAAVSREASTGTFEAETLIDAELRVIELGAALLEELDRLEPFGAGNPEPVFLLRAVTAQSRRIVGENHLKLQLRQDSAVVSAIAFGMGDAAISDGMQIDVVATVQRNDWHGSNAVDVHVREWRPTQNT